MQRNICCLYNKYFFENLYKFMVSKEQNSALDASGTFWHLLDVEEILIIEYGYRRTQTGIM